VLGAMGRGTGSERRCPLNWLPLLAIGTAIVWLSWHIYSLLHEIAAEIRRREIQAEALMWRATALGEINAAMSTAEMAKRLARRAHLDGLEDLACAFGKSARRLAERSAA